MKHNDQLDKFIRDLEAIKMTSAEKNEMRNHLHSFAQSYTVIPSPYQHVKTILQRSAVVAFAAILMIGSASHVASRNALPGDRLYFAKIAHEEIKVVTTFDTQKKISYQIKRTEKRIQEATALATQNELDDSAQNIIAEKINNQTNKVNKEIEKIKEEKPEEALILNSEFKSTLRINTQALRQASTTRPETETNESLLGSATPENTVDILKKPDQDLENIDTSKDQDTEVSEPDNDNKLLSETTQENLGQPDHANQENTDISIEKKAEDQDLENTNTPKDQDKKTKDSDQEDTTTSEVSQEASEQLDSITQEHTDVDIILHDPLPTEESAESNIQEKIITETEKVENLELQNPEEEKTPTSFAEKLLQNIDEKVQNAEDFEEKVSQEIIAQEEEISTPDTKEVPSEIIIPLIPLEPATLTEDSEILESPQEDTGTLEVQIKEEVTTPPRTSISENIKSLEDILALEQKIEDLKQQAQPNNQTNVGLYSHEGTLRKQADVFISEQKYKKAFLALTEILAFYQEQIIVHDIESSLGIEINNESLDIQKTSLIDPQQKPIAQ